MQWWILGLAARFPFPVWLLGGTIWLLYTGQIPKSQLAACYSSGICPSVGIGGPSYM